MIHQFQNFLMILTNPLNLMTQTSLRFLQYRMFQKPQMILMFQLFLMSQTIQMIQ
jgi:hypothetical protein